MDNDKLQEKIDKYTKNDKVRNGLGIASMVLGIVALSLLPCSIAGCLLYFVAIIAIVGLILGIVGLRKKNAVKGQAIAGVIMSGLVVGVSLIIIIVGLFSGSILNATKKSGDKQLCETIDSAMTTAAMSPEVNMASDFKISSMDDGKEHRITELPNSTYTSEVFDILGVYSTSSIENQLKVGDKIYFTVDGMSITVYCYQDGKEKPICVSD